MCLVFDLWCLGVCVLFCFASSYYVVVSLRYSMKSDAVMLLTLVFLLKTVFTVRAFLGPHKNSMVCPCLVLWRMSLTFSQGSNWTYKLFFSLVMFTVLFLSIHEHERSFSLSRTFDFLRCFRIFNCRDCSCPWFRFIPRYFLGNCK